MRGIVSRYSDEWFQNRMAATRRSAEVIAPFVREIVQPKSVIDLGCGTGSWLAALAVEDCLGVDGDWVLPSHLEFPYERFQKFDLTQPFAAGRDFDLALCIEVGEHLPRDAAETLVTSLTAHAPVVLFSAGIPHQGGTGHVNPQWPGYWAKKFVAHGYAPCDIVRPRFWCHPDVRFFHAQNLILYVRRDYLGRFGLTETAVLALVHPRLLQRLATRPGSLRRAAARIAGRSLGNPNP